MLPTTILLNHLIQLVDPVFPESCNSSIQTPALYRRWRPFRRKSGRTFMHGNSSINLASLGVVGRHRKMKSDGNGGFPVHIPLMLTSLPLLDYRDHHVTCLHTFVYFTVCFSACTSQCCPYHWDLPLILAFVSCHCTQQSAFISSLLGDQNIF